MNTTLCIGISSNRDSYEVAALEPGSGAVCMKFPATAMGLEGIKVFLAGHTSPLRLAVAGAAALSLALVLGQTPGSEVFIVSASLAGQPVALAHYAERSS